MDLVAGGVLHGRLPSRPLRFPLVLRSLPSPTVAVSAGAALPGCPCPPIVRRNAPAVVPFAKKKRKGYIDDPPDEAAADGLVDELEEDEEVEAGEDFDDDDEGSVCFGERVATPRSLHFGSISWLTLSERSYWDAICKLVPIVSEENAQMQLHCVLLAPTNTTELTKILELISFLIYISRLLI